MKKFSKVTKPVNWIPYKYGIQLKGLVIMICLSLISMIILSIHLWILIHLLGTIKVFCDKYQQKLMTQSPL